MLMKLFKHEWKDSWKLMTVLCVVVVALSALGAILFHDYGTIMDRLNMNDSDALDMMFAVGGMGYVCDSAADGFDHLFLCAFLQKSVYRSGLSHAYPSREQA